MRFDTPVISGSLIIASSTTASFFNGRIDLYETASANFIRFKAPENISASYVLTLPTASGQAGQAMIYDGSGSLYFGTVASSGGSTTILTAGISDVKAVGTGGGSAPSGSWQVRTLNTVDWDEIGLTVANNTITLPTGSYLIEASAPAYAVDEHQIRLFNSSSLSTLAYGSIEFASAVNGGSNRSVLQHSITVSGSIDIQLHHKVATSNLTPEGFGISDTGSFLNSTEIFSYLRIIKYQPALVYNNAYNTYSRTCRIIDLKASGSGGGAAVTGSWINRDLNTKSWDDIGVTLDTGSGIFTIPSGSYLLSISSPAHAVDEHQIRLYNTSSNSVEGYGTVEFAASTTGGTTRSHIFVKINNIANQSFTVQHRVGTSNTSIEALGTNTYDVLSDSEIFTTVDIVKYAHPALEPVAVLNDLLDVDTTGPVDDNYILSYDSASSAYRPISPTTARGFLSHWTSSISGIYRSGDVGIGISSSRSKLHVQHTSLPTSVPNLGDQATSAQLGDSAYGTLFSTINTGAGVIQQGRSDGTAVAYNLLLQPKGGNVAIGKITASKLLDVNGDALINSLTVGRGAGDVTTNTVVGNQALRINTTGYFNTAIGFEALYNNTTGINNIANGYASLRSNTTGRQNVATGNRTLYSITTAIGNTAIGDNVLYSLTSTSYTYNTAIGYNALSQLVTGTNNIAIGSDVANYTAGIVYNTSALNSIFIGNNTKPNAVGETNQIVIGDNAEGAGSNSVVLGNDGIDKTILKGRVVIGEGLTNPLSPLHIRSDDDNKIRLTDITGTTEYAVSTNNVNQFLITDVTNTKYPLIIDNNSPDSSIRINSTGVGIGTIPVNKFDVEGGVAIGATYSGTNAAPTNGLLVEGKTLFGNNSLVSGVVANAAASYQLNSQFFGNDTFSSGIQIFSNSSIASTNNLGGNLSFNASRNDTKGSHTLVENGCRIGSVLFGASDGTSYKRVAEISAHTWGTTGVDSMPGALFFKTTPSGSTSPVTSVTLLPDGYVGIGTSTPDVKLVVIGSQKLRGISTETTRLEIGTGRSGNGYAYIDLIGDATYTDYGARFIRNNSGPNAGTSIRHKGTGELNFITEDAANMAFYTSETNRLFISSSGNVGIGTTSPSHPIHLASGAHCTAAGTWTNASDIAYKYNIENLGYGLEDVMKLKPREFDMLADNSHAIGFVAQELEEVIPEIVSGEDGYKGVGYGPLVAVLVKAIQQQQSMLDVQQSLLDAQLKMIENLQEKVMMNTSIIEEMFNNG